MMLGLRAGHIFLLSIAVISAMKNKVINKLRKLKRISNIKKSKQCNTLSTFCAIIATLSAASLF